MAKGTPFYVCIAKNVCALEEEEKTSCLLHTKLDCGAFEHQAQKVHTTLL